MLYIGMLKKKNCRVGSDRTRFRIRTQSLHCLHADDRYT